MMNVETKGHTSIKTTMMAVALLTVLLLHSISLDAQEYRFLHGVISLDRAGYLIVNEDKRVNLLEETVVKNKKDQIIPLESLKAGKWVYIEGPLDLDGSVDAEVIYLLPRRISKKERHKYPFMKLPF